MAEKKNSLRLQSSDGETFEVEADTLANNSDLFGTLLDLYGISDKEEVIPLPNVSSAILRKILEWLNFHKYCSSHPYLELPNTALSKWDTQFLNVDTPTVFELLKAADYLQIEPLVIMACKKLARLIEGKSVEDIRNAFACVFVRAMTEEEEAKMRKDSLVARVRNAFNEQAEKDRARTLKRPFHDENGEDLFNVERKKPRRRNST